MQNEDYNGLTRTKKVLLTKFSGFLFFFMAVIAPWSLGLLKNFQLFKPFVRHLVGLLERGGGGHRKASTQDSAKQKNENIRLCLEWDSNP
jgi:hypothetical protein